MSNISQRGFTLIEMIVVIVITGIIAGVVAVFIRAPVQGYVDSARRAELTDIADTAVRRLARDIRTAVPNSVRIAGCGAVPCVEFMPTKDGGRYRAQLTGAGAGDILDFDVADPTFDIIGTATTVAVGDHIIVGSTQSDGNPPYQDPASAACADPLLSTCIRRTVTVAGTVTNITVASANPLPAFSRLWDAATPSQRFDVVDGVQGAVTYACEGVLGALDANGNGQASLIRHWSYGINAVQVLPAAGPSAILANNVSGCTITYAAANSRFGLVGVRLTITRGGESVNLYSEIHVSNVP